MHVVHEKGTSSKEVQDSKDKNAVLAFMVEVGLPSPQSWRLPVLLLKELLVPSSSSGPLSSSLPFQVGDERNEGFQPLVEALSRISIPSESGRGRRCLRPTMEGAEVLGWRL